MMMPMATTNTRIRQANSKILFQSSFGPAIAEFEHRLSSAASGFAGPGGRAGRVPFARRSG
jgi:hypothetical protein